MSPGLRLVKEDHRRDVKPGVPTSLHALLSDEIPSARAIEAYLYGPGLLRINLYVGWHSLFKRAEIRAAARRVLIRVWPFAADCKIRVLW